MSGAFARRVSRGMERRGLGLRELCREAGLDPSFFSKVLSGKRSPPAEEAVLRRLARVLEMDAAELIVSAGRIPSEWGALARDEELFRAVNGRIVGGAAVPARARPAAPLGTPRLFAPSPRPAALAEELL